MKRVVVTGVGALSPLGNDWPTVFARLKSMENAVVVMELLQQFEGMLTRLAAPTAPFTLDEKTYNRKTMRGMGRREASMRLAHSQFSTGACARGRDVSMLVTVRAPGGRLVGEDDAAFPIHLLVDRLGRDSGGDEQHRCDACADDFAVRVHAPHSKPGRAGDLWDNS